MGITGLIPFLDKTSRPIHISQFSGCSAAVDAYCWLHKGAFACADKLARGDKTDVYITYCMKYVNMLLSHNIKPILVFDGRHLPAKADTEKKRRQNRELNRRRAAELLRLDKPNEARTFLQRCIDVTHDMALELMRECRRRNVDCITAPYEADAQLAYLNIHNIAHFIITEDSDLPLFGCTKVVFKLDLAGNGLLVEQDRLHLAMGLSKACFSLDRFRQMCILSGCDYLPSLPKIGLAKACRFIKSTVDPDIHRALSRLGGHLNMNISVPLEYRDRFIEAEAMFKHQPVFDPLSRQLVPLTQPPAGTCTLPLLQQEKLSADQLLQLALGNLDPFTLTKVDDWSPDTTTTQPNTNSWNVKCKAPHKSIWSADFKPKAMVVEQPISNEVKRSSTVGKVLECKVEIPSLSTKRPLLSAEDELNVLRAQFGSSPHLNKKQRSDCTEVEDVLESCEKFDHTPPRSEVSSSDLTDSPKKTNVNPFTKSTPTSANKFSGLAKLARFRKTTVNDKDVVQSRYFGSPATHTSSSPSKPDGNKSLINTLKDVTNVPSKAVSPTEVPEKCQFKEKEEKLSDTSISCLLRHIEEDNKTVLSQSNGKENNTLNDSTNTKRANSFQWKPSLADMFGLKTKSLPSSSAVKSGFVNPSKSEIVAKNETTTSTSSESKTARKNPFAKTATKVEDLSGSLGSQGLSSNDSPTDVLTPDSICSEETTNTIISPVRVTPRPQMKVGLSKKPSTSCQRSLLSMFSFKEKQKLQR